MTGLSDRTGDIAAMIASAHRSGERLSPDRTPALTSLVDAMAVQAEVAGRLSAKVAAWKVAISADGTPVAAPIFGHLVHPGGATVGRPSNGPLGIEVEIAFRLARDLPPRPGNPYTREEVLAAAGTTLIGVELLDSRFVDRTKVAFLSALADNMTNGGYVAGDEIADWRALDLKAARCRILVDGEVVHDRVGGHPVGDPVAPFLAYASSQIDRLGGFKAGQIITTGSLCGVIDLDRPCKLEAEISGIGRVSFAVV